MAHLTGNFVDALFMGWESELLDVAGDEFDEERRMFADLAEDEDEDEMGGRRLLGIKKALRKLG